MRFLRHIFLSFSTYGNNFWLRRISVIVLICSIVLPVHAVFQEKLIKIGLKDSEFHKWVYIILSTCLTVAILIKDYLHFVVREKIAEKDEEIRRKTLTILLELLADLYAWKDETRVSLFIPQKNGKKKVLGVYTRTVHAGSEIPTHMGCFFERGQGLPGKAWSHAWDFSRPSGLVKAIQIGTVPENIVQGGENAIRDHFRNVFGVTDDRIFKSLSEDKLKLRAYLSVGFLEDDKSLMGVVSVDSMNENEFSDFEKLKEPQQLGFESGALMFSASMQNGEKEQGDQKAESVALDVIPQISFPQQMLEAIPEDVRSVLEGQINELHNSSDPNVKKRLSIAISHSITRGQLSNDPDFYLYPLEVILKKIRLCLRGHTDV